MLRGYFVDAAGKIADIKLAGAHLRAGAGHPHGGAAGLGGRLRQQSARVREPARLLHLGEPGHAGRPAVRAVLHRDRVLDRRAGRAGAGDRGAAGDRRRPAAADPAQPRGAPDLQGGRAEARRAGREHQRPRDHQEHRRRGPHAAQLGAVRHRDRALRHQGALPLGVRRQLLGAGAEPRHRRRGGVRRLSDRRGADDGRRAGRLHDHHRPRDGAARPGRRHPDPLPSGARLLRRAEPGHGAAGRAAARRRASCTARSCAARSSSRTSPSAIPGRSSRRSTASPS